MTLCYVIERIFAGMVRICTAIHKLMKKLFKNLNLLLVLQAL